MYIIINNQYNILKIWTHLYDKNISIYLYILQLFYFYFYFLYDFKSSFVKEAANWKEIKAANLKEI